MVAPKHIDKWGAKVKALYWEGISSREIGRRLGISESMAWSVCRELGLDMNAVLPTSRCQNGKHLLMEVQNEWPRGRRSPCMACRREAQKRQRARNIDRLRQRRRAIRNGRIVEWTPEARRSRMALLTNRILDMHDRLVAASTWWERDELKSELSRMRAEFDRHALAEDGISDQTA